MAEDQFEIREDASNKYWPFQVWNITKNWKVRTHPTIEAAQKDIDSLVAMQEPGFIEKSVAWQVLSDAEEAYENRFSTPLPEPEKPEAEEEAEFVDGIDHKFGDEITDDDGNVYVAIQASYYISSADAADIEDGWDAQVTVGWHTPARLKSQSTDAIIGQVQTGQAEIKRYANAWQVLFHDEDQLISLSDLDYSSEIGLYQKSKSPQLQGDVHE